MVLFAMPPSIGERISMDDSISIASLEVLKTVKHRNMMNWVGYLPGLAWLASFIGFEKAVAAGMLPFLAGDAVKAVLAAVIVTGAWTALKRKSA